MRGIKTTPPKSLAKARTTCPVTSVAWLPSPGAGPGTGHARRHKMARGGRRLAAVILALMLARCESARPDFNARSLQDCAQGDREACRMLDALSPPTNGQTAPARPAPPPRRTRVQTDVEAMMKGIERARSAPRAGYHENVPSHDAPVPAGPPPGHPPADGVPPE